MPPSVNGCKSRTAILLETNVKGSIEEFLWQNTKQKPKTLLKRVMERKYLNGHLSAQNVIGETAEEMWNWATSLTS